MRTISVLLSVALAVAVADARGGSNQGGTLVVHHDPTLIYSASCDSLLVPEDCSNLNPIAAADGSPQLWFVLAAFPDTRTDRLSTITFGIGYYDNSSLVMADWGPCELFGTALEIPSPGWPGPNSGTSVSWAPECGGGRLIPVYWFTTYAYATGTIPLGDYYPGQSGAFVSCGSPPEEDVVTEYGAMGFGMAGQNMCPEPGFTLEGTWGSIQAGGN